MLYFPGSRIVPLGQQWRHPMVPESLDRRELVSQTDVVNEFLMCSPSLLPVPSISHFHCGSRGENVVSVQG